MEIPLLGKIVGNIGNIVLRILLDNNLYDEYHLSFLVG